MLVPPMLICLTTTPGGSRSAVIVGKLTNELGPLCDVLTRFKLPLGEWHA